MVPYRVNDSRVDSRYMTQLYAPDIILTTMGIGIVLMAFGIVNPGFFILGAILSVGAFVSVFRFI